MASSAIWVLAACGQTTAVNERAPAQQVQASAWQENFDAGTDAYHAGDYVLAEDKLQTALRLSSRYQNRDAVEGLTLNQLGAVYL
ncbi:MAG: hypothetical protein ACE5Q3_14965, partial [Alphaproteobacteria bacterium]